MDMKQNNFQHTRKAIGTYSTFLKDWESRLALAEQENREGRLSNVSFTEKFWAMSEEIRTELSKVGDAFYEDTKDYNTLDNCKLAVLGNSKNLLPQVPKWIADLAAVDVP